MQTIPGNFSKLESLLASAKDGFPVILCLTKNMFIAKGNTKLLFFMCCNTKRFPDRLYCIHMTDPHDMKAIMELHVYSQSDADSLRFLDQLKKYQDFAPQFYCLKSMIMFRCSISLCFLENVLQDAQGKIKFLFVSFKNARKGHEFSNIWMWCYGCVCGLWCWCPRQPKSMSITSGTE